MAKRRDVIDGALALVHRLRRAHGGAVRGYQDGGAPGADADWGGAIPLDLSEAGPSTGDILSAGPRRMMDRERRQLLAKELADMGLSAGEIAKLDAAERYKSDVGEPAAMNAIGELSGVNSMGRGARDIGRGASEGDWKRGIHGVGEFALGALPGAGVARGVSPGARAVLEPFLGTGARTMATSMAGSTAMLPFDISTAQGASEAKLADVVGRDPEVVRLRNEIDKIEAERINSTKTPIKGMTPQSADQARKNADQAFDKRIGALRAELDKAADRARDAYLKEAPFRERYPGASESILWGSGALAGGLAGANALKNNLANKFVRDPMIARQTQRVEDALSGGQSNPGAFARMFGAKPEAIAANESAFAREQSVLDRMLAARESAAPSATKNALLGAGLIAEGRMIPEEVDAIAFPYGHETRNKATDALTSKDYYLSGVVPSLLGGIATGAASKVADTFSKGSAPALSRAEAVRDWTWANKGPTARGAQSMMPVEPGMAERLGSAPGRVIQAYYDQKARTAAARQDALGSQQASDQRRLSSTATPRQLDGPTGAPALPAPADKARPSLSDAPSRNQSSLPPPNDELAMPNIGRGVGAGQGDQTVNLGARGPTRIEAPVDKATPAVAKSTFVPGDAERSHPHMKHPGRPKDAVGFNDATGRYHAADGRFLGGPPVGKVHKPEERASGGSVGASHDAMTLARRYATGGAVHVGPVVGATGGRADELPVSVPSGSYVLPADVVSALGEGNTLAGMSKLERAFGKSNPRGNMASGGAIPAQPILISDGEYVLDRDQVAKLGQGDLERGYKVLDRFVVDTRKDHVNTLSKLPPPAKSNE